MQPSLSSIPETQPLVIEGPFSSIDEPDDILERSMDNLETLEHSSKDRLDDSEDVNECVEEDNNSSQDDEDDGDESRSQSDLSKLLACL